MASSMKSVWLLGLVLVLCTVGLEIVDGAGGCGRTSLEMNALSLAPCTQASKDENAAVPESCCSVLKRIGQNPDCLCDVMLSETARRAGVNPEIAMTLAKRCNLGVQAVGATCGGYTMP